MTELGSIFEPEAPGPRGRDLHADVTVPAWALGLPFGYEVQIPLELAAEGGYARRFVPPSAAEGEAQGRIRLSLPAGFPSGGIVRLRGQGEAHSEGRPGDLLVHVDVDRRRSEPPPEIAAALAAYHAARSAPPPDGAAGPVAYRIHSSPQITAATVTWLAAVLAGIVAWALYAGWM